MPLARDSVGDRRDALDLGQSQPAEQTDPGPAQIELPLAHRQLGRVRVGVVVVVQFLPGDQQAPGQQVGRGVSAFEVAVADRVPQAVDHAGGPQGNPQHLEPPDGESERAEQAQVEQRHEGDTGIGKAGVEAALDPVVRTVLAVEAQGFRILRLAPIQFGPPAQNGEQALVPRAVGVVDGFALGVVLAVDGRPLAGVHGRGQPQPETEEMLKDGV